MLPSNSVSVSIALKPQRVTQRRDTVTRYFSFSVIKSPIIVTSFRRTRFAVLEAYKSDQRKYISSVDLDASLKIFEFWGLEYDEFLKLVRAHPSILNEDRNKAKQIFDALKKYGFEKDQFKYILVRHPNLLQIDLENLHRIHAYLSESLEMTSEQFVKMVLKRPKTILSDLNSIQLFCDFFQEILPLEPLDVAKILSTRPSLLKFDLESNLKPKLEFFLAEIGVLETIFATRIKRQSNVLHLSLSRIKERIIWMKKTFDYTDANIRHLCSSSLAFIILRRPLLESKIDNLCEMFDFHRMRCGDLIKLYPNILTFSAQNINKTFNFITQEMHCDVEEVLKEPNLLTHSIEKRIRPRYKILQEIGFPKGDISLRVLYRSTDADFWKLLESYGFQNAKNVMKDVLV